MVVPPWSRSLTVKSARAVLDSVRVWTVSGPSAKPSSALAEDAIARMVAERTVKDFILNDLDGLLVRTWR